MTTAQRWGGGLTSHSFHDVDRTGDVGGKGADRIGVGEPDERLGGEMEDEIGRQFADDLAHERQIANIAASVGQARFELELTKERWLLDIDRIPGDISAEGEQPFAEPSSLEPCVTGDQDFFFRVDISERGRGWSCRFRHLDLPARFLDFAFGAAAPLPSRQTFHGALPLAQRRLRYCISW